MDKKITEPLLSIKSHVDCNTNQFGDDIIMPVDVPENATELEQSFHKFFDSMKIQRVNIPYFIESKNKHESPELKALYRKNSGKSCLSVCSR